MLQDSQTEYIQEQVSGWYVERIAELRSLQAAIEHYHMTKNEDMEMISYLKEMVSRNGESGIYDYMEGGLKDLVKAQEFLNEIKKYIL